MRTTVRSRILLASSVGFAFSEALFQNILIAIVLLVLIALLLGEYLFIIAVTSRPGRWFSISEDSSQKEVLYPGDKSTSNHLLRKRVSAGVSLYSRLTFLNLDPNVVPRSERSKEINVDFKTPFAGDYRVETLELSVMGPLKLFSGDCSIQFDKQYSVFPRVVQVAATSSSILGRTGLGDTPIDVTGLGTELHELRYYQYGDDYRQINWKASARTNQLIVNERQREVGTSYYLVLDLRAEEYSERDRLASAFLHVANMLTVLAVNFGVVVHDGEKIKAIRKIGAPESSLDFSLSAALDFVKVRGTELPETLTAVASYAMKANQKMLMEGGYEVLSETENLGRMNLRRVLSVGEPMRDLIQLTTDRPNDSPVFVYFSALHGSMNQIIEAATQIRWNSSGKFVLVAPTMPWVTSSTEEEAYQAYIKFHEKLRAFEVSRVDYAVGEPIAIAKRLLEVRP